VLGCFLDRHVCVETENECGSLPDGKSVESTLEPVPFNESVIPVDPGLGELGTLSQQETSLDPVPAGMAYHSVCNSPEQVLPES
jgi:hypothetical protein